MGAVAFTVAEPHHDMSHEVDGGVLIYRSRWPRPCTIIAWKHLGIADVGACN